MNQKPSMGRIVLYTPTAEMNPHGADANKKQWPAIVTHVWDDSSISVNVFGCPAFGLPSVPLRLAFDAAGEQGNGAGGSWCWPPRV